MIFARIILAIQVVVLGGLGLAYWLQPYEMANLNGMLLMESISVINTRVFYGGFQVGLALYLAWSMGDRVRARGGLMLLVLLQSMLALARISALWLDGGEFQFADLSSLLLKVFTALLAALALWRLDRQAKAEVLEAAEWDEFHGAHEVPQAQRRRSLDTSLDEPPQAPPAA
ncbi:DUF4345 domain-containing protein [Pseudomonas sp. UL073]|uniref:DUF4345 domain-containing protein n=1 Tax=Zestomonas insulae TaxID=2809017 RepID=A0ABS2IEE5_9GAMM|nr:DUF4345 domain-containing protein [Pseudomonas insulae]MBM7061464.1 DUF4345 domain-containing protein [Pseudomonas insulae]